VQSREGKAARFDDLERSVFGDVFHQHDGAPGPIRGNSG
jgi:hypothetical protein